MITMESYPRGCEHWNDVWMRYVNTARDYCYRKCDLVPISQLMLSRCDQIITEHVTNNVWVQLFVTSYRQVRLIVISCPGLIVHTK